MTITLRGAIIGVLTVGLCLGLYLLWLWRPEHQVRLHTEHFFRAIDDRNWESVAISLAKTIATSGTRNVRGFLSGCGKVFDGCAAQGLLRPTLRCELTPRAIWIGKINVYSSDDGVMQFLDERVNRLPTPFELEWYHVSGKPWDWKLVRVSNPAFQSPADVY